MTRATIHEPSVSSRMLPNNIGYARLAVFGASTAHELSNALDKLQAQGARAYVLDLRYNGGGYLDAAIDVSSKFVPSGPIVSVQSRGGSETEYDAENTAIAPRPLAVLVNGGTASASEITSGAIQDSGVGELVGERTYGKGVVQTIHPLPDGSAVKITSARYLTPKGRDINTVGIQPDMCLARSQEGRAPRRSANRHAASGRYFAAREQIAQTECDRRSRSRSGGYELNSARCTSRNEVNGVKGRPSSAR